VIVRVEEATGEPIEGHPTRRTSLALEYKLDFDVGGDSSFAPRRGDGDFLDDRCDSLWRLPLSLRPGFKTGFADIDAKVSEALAGAKGFPLKQELRITGRVEGEPPSTERFEIVIDSFEASDCNAACFEVPNGFVHRVPVFGQPEVESKVVPKVP
jgi:hypothetical protein